MRMTLIHPVSIIDYHLDSGSMALMPVSQKYHLAQLDRASDGIMVAKYSFEYASSSLVVGNMPV